MIQKSHKNKIKKVLGFDYSAQIASYIYDKGLRNSNGQPYSIYSVINVMNGRKNPEMEALIYQLVEEKKEEKKEETAKRQRILSA